MPETIKKFDLPGVGEVEIYTEWTDDDEHESELCVEFPSAYASDWFYLEEFVSEKLQWAKDVGWDAGDRFTICLDEIQSTYGWELEEVLIEYAKQEQEDA